MDIIRTGIPNSRTPPAKGKCSYLAMGRKEGKGRRKEGKGRKKELKYGF